MKDMEESVLAHKHRRNRTDGNFITTINETDEDRAQQKLNHYKRNVPIKEGEEIPTQPIQCGHSITNAVRYGYMHMKT